MYLRPGHVAWDVPESAEPTPGVVSLPDGNGRRARWRATSAWDRSPRRPFPVVYIRGVALHAITEVQCVQHVLDELDAGRGGVLVTPNLDHLHRCIHDVSFGALVAEADLVVADGMPLVWASRLQGTPLPQRVAGSNLISSLSAAAGARNRSVFLLGGAPGTAEAAAKVLTDKFPQVKIAGTYCPPVGFEYDPAQVAEIVRQLKEAAADIVYVALGSPKQEKLIERIRAALPQAWWAGVGVSFSFLCGDVKRAPKWMQKTGLEWVHRLSQEPKRLFHRYIVVGLPFAAGLFGRSLAKRVFRRDRRYAPATLAVPELRDGNDIAPPSIEVRESPARVTRPIAASGALSNLRALVLLGGSVRPTPLSGSIGRSTLDLPIDADRTILTNWVEHAAEVARLAGIPALPVRVRLDRNAPEPLSAAGKFAADICRIERDATEFRGTGGILADLATEYADDDLILVANASQILLSPLADLAAGLKAKDGIVSVVSHRDGTPSGIMLVTAKALRLIPRTGFVDMKEQALPLIASQFDVTVVHRRRPTGLSVRSTDDYIQAVRLYHLRKNGQAGPIDPLAEDWRATFGLVESGATVDASARVHDSVVLRGATVEPGAVLVRSVVCEGAVVKRDRSVVGQLVTANRSSRKEVRAS